MKRKSVNEINRVQNEQDEDKENKAVEANRQAIEDDEEAEAAS